MKFIIFLQTINFPKQFCIDSLPGNFGGELGKTLSSLVDNNKEPENSPPAKKILLGKHVQI